eukprot:TRINITY_DN10763_c0_g1_i2.p1 TRINITY_DN10763_c0_g1~~TRINITY_DN10763_c0_g1_i2.p1  ORF type:complete len:273 (+),score=83.43 TRINITY_DN10763_c0_g1_i2:586-1404(+)
MISVISILIGTVISILIVKLSNSFDVQLLVINSLTLAVSSALEGCLLYSAFKGLKWLNENVSSTVELMFVLADYFVFLIVYHSMVLPWNGEISEKKFKERCFFIGLILIIRNVIWLGCLQKRLLGQEDKSYLVSNRETRECIKNLHMTMSCKYSCSAFAHYLSGHHEDGETMFSLFSLLVIRKARKRRREELSAVEEEIQELCVSNVHVRSCIDISHWEMNDMAFDAVMTVAKKKLEECFEEFKKSGAYRELRKALIRKERINEKLQYADLI